MKLLVKLFLCVTLLLIATPVSKAEANSCKQQQHASAVWWKGQEVVYKQEAMLAVIKKTNLYEIQGKKKVKVGSLKSGEKRPVFSSKSNWINVGDGKYVKKTSRVSVKSLPKKVRNEATCAYKAKKELKKQADQMIVVTGKNKNSAKLKLYEKKKGKWKAAATYSGIVGKNGIGKTKEGDGKTPKGTFLLGNAFGWGKEPKGLEYPYRTVSLYDYWVDDVKSKDYNKWVNYKGNPKKKWNSFEKLNHPLYKHAVVIRYNENPIKKGKGSAIFLHMKKQSTKYTLGCVAVREKDILKILRWLDDEKNPIIIIK